VEQKLMTGNEAVARGTWEAGATVAAAYPGTPSTEITENAAKYAELYAEWAPNEKVAFEVALGAAVAGARAMTAMKHVGVNVAADALFTSVYTGVNGGLTVVCADDPDMHSSQNEQDTRHYGRAAMLPILEPSSSQEAKDFCKLAFSLSEQFDTPVILRLTTRIAHSQSLVELGEREEYVSKGYKKDAAKYVMSPGFARKRRLEVQKHMRALSEYAEESPLNRAEMADSSIGIITSGVLYQYVKEVLPQASVLKLGMTHPLPRRLIEGFAAQVDKLYVVEELGPFLEDTIKSWGLAVTGQELFSPIGEVFAQDIAAALGGVSLPPLPPDELPARPPLMCAGCPHRGLFYLLHKHKLTVTGDIGCYTLAAGPPLSAIDTCVCMGSSVSMAHGMEKAGHPAHKTVAVLGESTFLHSGIHPLINTVYNQSAVTTIILDNSTTAMTGHQHNPASGFNAKGRPAPAVDIPALATACGVKHVQVVDPFDLKATENALKAALQFAGPSVLITKSPCILLDKKAQFKPYAVGPGCTGCKICLKMACPALGLQEVPGRAKAKIEAAQCAGCGLCAAVCPSGSITRGEA